MEAKEFKWENERYRETREHHDGIACSTLDVFIAYSLMLFAGLSFVLALLGISLLLLRH
ncbi:hypothetical protein [Anthocerotibacter panamensis]|uniref:hypothetical protein n=1 Tax=Anthocerotibacter panamensis TaxID=2857077 RepID=UPI001C402699|nr:hypothetical protein [Anthocerotibacter panamensis]